MSSEEIKQAVFAMYTDPNHLKVSDPGQVEAIRCSPIWMPSTPTRHWWPR